MNRFIIAMIAIVVVIGAMFTAVMIFMPNDKQEVENIKTEIAQEEILDDCTDEYEGMEYEETVKANTQEEKTSPNCSIITKTYYKKCGHTQKEYANLSQELVNLTQKEIQERYKDCKIESFTANEIVLYQEKEGECGEHYMIKDKDGQVVIYQILENGEQQELEVTAITTEYLPETDKINMKKGIQVNGRQELNQLIEDFE